ncbi:MAG: hypothetical protein IIA14_01995 [SAR324 cluster bacterium]|nr:hypothetical protein [SAR324 cluster bacterium]
MKPLVAILALFLVTAGVTLGHRAFAQGSPPGQGVYTWVEDGKLRQVWLDPKLIAEFGPTGGQEGPGAGVREAKGLSGSGPVIRFWTLEEQTTQEAGLTMLRTANPVGRFSPVFHFQPNGVAKLALPGNVILFLDPGWDSDQVTDWVAEHGVQVVSALNFGKNILLVASPSGLETLAVADGLRQLEGVVQSVPNWWFEPFTR